MRAALLRHTNLSFGAAYARKVKCNKRISRIRRRCKLEWIVGDLYFYGKGTIWETRGPDAAFWNYSYKVTRFNEYCAIVLEGEDCTKKYVVR